MGNASFVTIEVGKLDLVSKLVWVIRSMVLFACSHNSIKQSSKGIFLSIDQPIQIEKEFHEFLKKFDEQTIIAMQAFFEGKVILFIE